ncbi:MAG: tetratricopeptide repeat protein [Sphingobacteriaceae bacterium]|nr:MAG: tetratricopeptide repeat protein [Sphingobacteriaceae bacterium]
MARKLLLSILFLAGTTSFGFSQSEQLKDVFNNLAFYNQKHDLKFLGEAKKAIDKVIVTKSDSANLYKSVYRAVVYTTILYADSANTLHMPDNFLSTTNIYADTLFKRPKVYSFSQEITYIKRNLANAYIRRGFTDLKKNSYQSAITDFDKAKSIVPSAENLSVYLAYAANKMGELSKSASYYDHLLDSDKPGAEVILTAQRIYKLLGDTTKALIAIEKGRRIYPENKKLLYEEANIYNNKKDYEALRKLLVTLVKVSPDDYDINFLAAVCYDHLNQPDQAEKYYKKAIQLDPNSYDPVFNLGVLYMKKEYADPNPSIEKYNTARNLLEKANDLNPNDPQFLQTLKLLYDKTGNTEQSNKISTQLNQIIN